MFSSFGQIVGRPQLLILSLMIFAQGSAFGATIPYLSVTAIGTLGMSDQAYSLLVLVSSVSAVTISVSLGILSDMLGDRRHMLIAMSALGVVGYGAIYLFPSVPVFLGATSLIIPFFYAPALCCLPARGWKPGTLSRRRPLRSMPPCEPSSPLPGC